MKALVCRAYGPVDSLVVEEVPDPKPVAGRGARRRSRVRGELSRSARRAGQVPVQAGAAVLARGRGRRRRRGRGAGVTGVRVGDRVVAMASSGGIAEKFVADASQVVRRSPTASTSPRRACVPTAYGTTLHALRDRAQLRAGRDAARARSGRRRRAAAVQIGKRMGARVIAAASSPEKLATCKQPRRRRARRTTRART